MLLKKYILDNLLADLEKAYEQSDISKYCIEQGHEWFYSLVTTSMKTGGPLVLGFNWGASQNEKYKPQTAIEITNFRYEDIGSLSRIFPYCKKYFGHDFISTITQSNYCFFRSKNEAQISLRDIELCEPIFLNLIDAIKPSSILCFSSKLRDFMFNNDRIASKHSKDIKFLRGNSMITYKAIKATLRSGVEIRFLPHPNYPMKLEARNEAWEFCCVTD